MKPINLRDWEVCALAAGATTLIRPVEQHVKWAVPPVPIPGQPSLFGELRSNGPGKNPDYLCVCECPFGVPGDRLVASQRTIDTADVCVLRAANLDNTHFWDLCGNPLCAVPDTGDAWEDFYQAFEAPFIEQWDRDYPRYPWASNPWVWFATVQTVEGE